MIGTSTSDRFVTPRSGVIDLPRKCLLSPLFFFRVVMFLAESGLMDGKEGEAGLCMVSGSNTEGYLRRSESRSLSDLLTGERSGEMVRVGANATPFPFDNAVGGDAGDDDWGGSK